MRRETIHRMGRRLPDFDYASRRIYEITVVLEERRPILGRLAKIGAALSGRGPDGGGGKPGQGWAVEPSEWGEVEIDYKGMSPDNIDEFARSAAKVKRDTRG